jgi:EamA-like transporter family.
MAYLFLGEKLSNIDIAGFILATIGVYIATRK